MNVPFKRETQLYLFIFPIIFCAVYLIWSLCDQVNFYRENESKNIENVKIDKRKIQDT